MRLKSIFVVALLSLSLRMQPAFAEGDVPAAACVPTDSTIMEGLYQLGASGYSFSGSNVGTYTVTCPVTLANGEYRLNLSYKNDTDGAATGDYMVHVELVRRSLSTGDTFTLCVDWSRSTTNMTWMCGETPWSYFQVNNNSYAYFVNVTLFRRYTQSSSIEFGGLSFANKP